jgi:hypothetical protein
VECLLQNALAFLPPSPVQAKVELASSLMSPFWPKPKEVVPSGAMAGSSVGNYLPVPSTVESTEQQADLKEKE